MDNSFADTISRWHDFYLLAGGAAATLTGLLFVAVSIHIDLVATEEAKSLRGIAGQILFNFVYVIAISLAIVNPIVSRLPLATVLLGIGATGLVRIITRAFRLARLEKTWFRDQVRQPINIFAHLVLPTACYVSFITSGFMLFEPTDQSPTVLVALMIAIFYLLVRSIVDTWNMLIQVAIAKRIRSQNITG